MNADTPELAEPLDVFEQLGDVAIDRGIRVQEQDHLYRAVERPHGVIRSRPKADIGAGDDLLDSGMLAGNVYGSVRRPAVSNHDMSACCIVLERVQAARQIGLIVVGHDDHGEIGD